MITKTVAQAILRPHEAQLYRCVRAGWERWETIVAPSLPMPSARGQANAVYEYMIDEARQGFGATPGVQIEERAQRLLLVVESRLIIRFKKLDRDLLTKNYPTRQALLFDAQEPLPGVPETERITVGYRLDPITLSNPEAWVVYAIGKSVHWAYQLTETQVNVVEFPRVSQLELEPRRLARPRRENDSSKRDRRE